MATTIQSLQGMLGGTLASQNSSTSTAATTTSASSSSSALDMNAFLQMFTTQLKYQDPSNPLESHEMAAQLAQFSSVEKLTQATTLLNNIQNLSIGINNTGIASLVGKDVTALKSTVAVTADSVGTLDYKLDAPATVTITIKDSSGNTVQTLTRNVESAGSYKVEWDGKDTTGTRVQDGEYTCEVKALNQAGETSTVRTSIHGVVYSCNLDSSNPTYLLSGPDGIRVPVSDVYEIAQNTTS
ncbi:MAG: flagellar hook assembly protein FlgD [Syntrophobacteraceae bacterium]